MRPFPALVVVALLAALTGAGCGGGSDSGSGPAQLTFFTFNEKSGSYDNAAKTCAKQSNGAYEIKKELLPAGADGQREQLVRRLAAEDESIDIMAMDVVWTPEFAEAKWIRPFPQDMRTEIEKETLAKPLQTATYENKLYGAPFNTNAQILYYRKDLVKTPPKTWADMIDAATKIGGDAGHIEVQAAQYEGYTVWFNSMVASAGGQILKGEDKADLGPPAVKALTVMRDLAKSKAADPSMSNQMEDQGVVAISAGKAAFMVNYPDFYAQIKKESPKVYENIGLARWPRVEAGRPSKSTIGGINLGVSAFSKHPQEALAAATCMRSKTNQRFAVTKGNYAPSIGTLLDEQKVKDTLPFAELLKETLTDAALRPRSPAYNDISLAVQKTISPPKSIDPEGQADAMKTKIEKALRSGGLL